SWSSRCERILVGAWSINGGHQRTNLSQIYGQLSPVVIPVIEHDLPQNSPTGQCHDLASAVHDLPGLAERRIVHSAKNLPRLGDAVIEGLHQLCGTCRARLGEFRYLKWRLLAHFGNATWS